jgi:anthranilate phosphoribosyltransferase
MALGSNWIEHVLAGRDLSESEAADALKAMAEGRLEPAVAGGLLVALRSKGEAASEIRGFAQAMRELARRPQLSADGPYVDIVGTGGDSSHSLNLSTGSALLAAACGLAVVKHGNRSITSRCGSADVLSALGLPIPLDERQAGVCLDETGFTFLFAPHYHPAMKNIGPVRTALGVRTVFNILGPLANPAQPPYHVIGAFSDAMAERMAEALAGMQGTRAFVIHGSPGWDEVTPVGPFLCFDVRPGKVERSVRDPKDFGIARCNPDELKGGDAQGNAERLRQALRGEDTRAHRDALILGAALALEVTGRAPDFDAAVREARAAIEDGRSAALLERLKRVGGELAG